MTLVSQAARSLWRRRQLTLVSIALLALGVGANVVLFALADAVLFRPFPFDAPDRLVIGGRRQAGQRAEIAYPDFVDWRTRTRSRSFDDLAAMASSDWTGTLRIDEPSPIEYRAVSGNFFDVVGARAAIGRALTDADDRRGAALVLVISDRFWRRQFGGDPAIVGRSVALNGRLYTIVGVMPPSFTYPDRPDAWTAIVPGVERFPIPGEPDFVDNRNVGVLFVVGRLRRGVTLETARDDLDRVSRELAATFGRARDATTMLTPIVDDAIGSARVRLWALLAAVALLLAAASANVAGLTLVQVSARRRDFAVRLALGASRWTIVRELLAESAILVAVACTCALVAARATVPLLMAVLPPDIPRIEEASVGVAAVEYTLCVGALVVAVCGLIPAMGLRSAHLEDALRGGGRSLTTSAGQRRARQLMVVAEIVIAVVIVAGAALLYRSVARLNRLDVGFAPDRLLAVEVQLPSALQAAPRADVHRFYTRVIDALRGLPSVESVAGVAGRPLQGPIGLDSSWQREGQSIEDAQHNPWANLETVTPSYFRTMGTRILEGRPFTDDDRMATAPVVVVSEAFARRAWPGEPAIGKRLRGHGFDESGAAPPWWTVVGIAQDVRFRDLRSPTLDVYVPYDQSEFDIGDVVLRTHDPAAASIPAVRARLRSVDADGLLRVAVMTDEVTREQGPWRANLLFFEFFGGLTVLIAVVGVYALLAATVAEQSRDFGVRLALGATSARVVGEVLAGAGRMAAIGAALGLAAALAAGRFARALLFEVSPFDIQTLVAAAAALMMVALAATLLPAVRASRVDPIVSLRTE